MSQIVGLTRKSRSQEVKNGTNSRKYKGVLASCPPQLCCPASALLGEALWMTQQSFLVRLHDFMLTIQSALHVHSHAYYESFNPISELGHARSLNYADHIILAQCAAI
jgi:hypothetical protein